MKATTLDQLIKVSNSERLQIVMKEMEVYVKNSESGFRTIAGPVEADPEYKLIVEANNIAAEIDNEISKLIKFNSSSVHDQERTPM